MSTVWCDSSLMDSHLPYGLILTEAEFHKVLDKMDFPRSGRPFWLSENASAVTHTFRHKSASFILVCMDKLEGYDGIAVAGILVHEATHIWQEYCEFIGESEPSVEFEAYTIQRISENLMREYVKRVMNTSQTKD